MRNKQVRYLISGLLHLQGYSQEQINSEKSKEEEKEIHRYYKFTTQHILETYKKKFGLW